MISAMTGQWLDGPEAGADYWYDSLRNPVEFSQAVEALAKGGHQVFIEHPAPGADRRGYRDAGERHAGRRGREPEPVVTGTLRRDDGGPARFLASLAEVHVRGVTVDWAAVTGGGRAVELPTYAFQRQRYWPRQAAVRGAGAAEMGLAAVGHPLLGAGVELAGGEGYLLTGLLSVRAQPWLADHVVAGTVLLPGTAFVEMAIRAGDAAGCGRIEELTLEAPLVLPAGGAVRVQVVVDGPDPSGGREVSVYARPADTAAAGTWPGTPAGGWLRRSRPARRWPGSSRCGRRRRRAGPCTGCMRRWRRPGTGTVRPSAGCGRPGAEARRSSPRSRCRPRRPVTRGRSGCTRRSSMPPCTRSEWRVRQDSRDFPR